VDRDQSRGHVILSMVIQLRLGPELDPDLLGNGTCHHAPSSRRAAKVTGHQCRMVCTNCRPPSRSLEQARRILRFTTGAFVPAYGTTDIVIS
jgi:hypothetical protein